MGRTPQNVSWKIVCGYWTLYIGLVWYQTLALANLISCDFLTKTHTPYYF